MTEIRQQKDTLAKLMATENITVVHKAIPTAYFDVKNRVLACPTFKDDISSELYDLFMGHEVGHALYTPYEGLHSTIKNNRTLKGYLNVIEDVRIERKIRDKFAGLRKSFFKAYDELMQKDFFGIKNRDLQSLSLIDKINLITKVGSRVNIKLNDVEQAFLDASYKCETWEDVVQVANAIYEWSKENESRNEDDSQLVKTLLGDDFDIDLDEEDEEPTFGDQWEDTDDEYEDNEDEDTFGEDGEDEEQASKGDDSSEQNTEEESEEERDLSKDTSGKMGGEFDSEDGARESITEHNAHSNENDFIDENASIKTYCNLDTFFAKDGVVDKIIVGYKDVFKDFDAHNGPKPAEEYRSEWHNKEYPRWIEMSEKVTKYLSDKSKKVVMHMAKEFDMRQTAKLAVRARVAKSGKLDMNKLAKYQIIDDVFKQMTYLPKGKNHGVQVLLDWSGSIANEAKDILEQAIILAEFCRKVQLPYRVYLFSDCYSPDSSWYDHDGRLIEILSNEMTGREHKKALNAISQLYIGSWARNINYWQTNEKTEAFFEATGYDLTQDSGSLTWNIVPNKYNFSGTPLDHSIIAMRKLVPAFNKRYGIEKSILTVVTDGFSHESQMLKKTDEEYADQRSQETEDSWRGTSHRYLKDPYTKASYLFDGNYIDAWNRTCNLLEWISDTTGVTITGYFIFSKKRDFSNLVYYLKEISWSEEASSWRQMKKTGLVVNSKGYNKLFLTTSNNLLASGDDELDTDLVGAKKSKVLSAFKRNQKSKTTSRFLTNEFIKEIA